MRVKEQFQAKARAEIAVYTAGRASINAAIALIEAGQAHYAGCFLAASRLALDVAITGKGRKK